MAGFLTVHRICNASKGPEPTRAVLCEMLDQLTRTLAALGLRPVRVLKTESWSWRAQPNGHEELLARLRIECEPGEPTRPFASWYQWQHPAWVWSLAMLPTVDLTAVERTHVETLVLVPPATPAAGHEARP